MKAYFTVSCLLIISTTFANSAKQAEAYPIEDETVSFFQHYLTKCRKHKITDQQKCLKFCLLGEEETMTI